VNNLYKERSETMKQMNKKPLIALVLIAVVGLVGTTFAYFTSSNTFENIFKTKTYQTKVVETFTSPSDWTPGTTTTKTLKITNEGTAPVAVRVKIDESWVDSNNKTLSLTDKNGTTVAVINYMDGLANTWDCTTKTGYCYLKASLAAGDSLTDTLIKSVTFNKDVDLEVATSCTNNTDGSGKTCTNTTNGYAGGTYTLKLTVETIQYDLRSSVWGYTA
jgi:alternate signal-mediated exported protein